jgi:hypothetical protein
MYWLWRVTKVGSCKMNTNPTSLSEWAVYGLCDGGKRSERLIIQQFFVKITLSHRLKSHARP